MMWLAVALGGALGSMARHWVNLAFVHQFERSVPYATAAVNMIGSLLIGFLAGMIAIDRVRLSPTVRTFVFVGLIGGFTTFSSLMLDTLTLANGGNLTTAVTNLIGQLAFGMTLVWAGYYAALAFR